MSLATEFESRLREEITTRIARALETPNERKVHVNSVLVSKPSQPISTWTGRPSKWVHEQQLVYWGGRKYGFAFDESGVLYRLERIGGALFWFSPMPRIIFVPVSVDALSYDELSQARDMIEAVVGPKSVRAPKPRPQPSSGTL